MHGFPWEDGAPLPVLDCDGGADFPLPIFRIMRKPDS
jgi:hypothetical protein